MVQPSIGTHLESFVENIQIKEGTNTLQLCILECETHRQIAFAPQKCDLVLRLSVETCVLAVCPNANEANKSDSLTRCSMPQSLKRTAPMNS